MKGFIVLGLFLLVQGDFARSIENYSFQPLNSNNPFYENTASEFTAYSIQYFAEFHNATENVLYELKNSTDFDAAIIEEIENLEHVDCEIYCVLNDEKNQTISRIVQLHGILNDLQYYYNNTDHSDSKVWQLLLKYDIGNVIEQFYVDLDVFFVVFIDNFRVYLRNLSEPVPPTHYPLVDWFNEFQFETVPENPTRFYKFLEFFLFWDSFKFEEYWGIQN